MKIGLDFDGVIADCGKLKSEGAKLLYGVDIPGERFKKELVLETGILTEDQYRKVQAMVYSRRDIGMRMEPVKDALKYLRMVLNDGHDLRVITSRGEI